MKQPKTITTLDVVRKIRKPMPPPSRVIQNKTKYNRKNKDWKDD